MGPGHLSANTEKPKPHIISCSVLKNEINHLTQQGLLNADVVYVSKLYHVDYTLLEKNLRRTIKKTLTQTSNKPILVYGDLCLGPNDEMKKLAREYGLTKIDALNCIDCLLGGKGKITQADPNHEHMFFDPGMVEFFEDAQKKLRKQGADEETMKNMFTGIKGIILLDTLGEPEKLKKRTQNLHTGLPILETKEVGLRNLKHVLEEAIQKNPTSKTKPK